MGLSLEMALCKGTSLKMAFLFALLVLLLQPEMAIAGKRDKPAKAEMPPLHWWRIRWSNNEWLYSDPFALTWRSLSKAEESTLQDWLSRGARNGPVLVLHSGPPPLPWKILPGMFKNPGGLTSLVTQMMEGPL